MLLSRTVIPKWLYCFYLIIHKSFTENSKFHEGVNHKLKGPDIEIPLQQQQNMFIKQNNDLSHDYLVHLFQIIIYWLCPWYELK